jgi:hypothetical protein
MTSTFNKFAFDLQLAYADVLEKIFNDWTHLDDGACNYESTGKKHFYVMNSVQVIYQPIGTEPCWYDDACVIFTPTKESGITFTKAMYNKAKPLLRECEQKLIDSVNGFITKYGGWIEPSNDKPLTFKQIVGIVTPLEFDEKYGKLRFRWELKSLYDNLSRYWNPVELMNWKYSLASFQVYNASEIHKDIKDVKNSISGLKQKASECKVQIAFLDPNSDEYTDLQSKMQNAYSWISIQTDNLKILEESLMKPFPVQEKYICEDEEYIKDWFKSHGDTYVRKNTISYMDAFPELYMSGKKRILNDDETSDAKKTKK